MVKSTLNCFALNEPYLQGPAKDLNNSKRIDWGELSDIVGPS